MHQGSRNLVETHTSKWIKIVLEEILARVISELSTTSVIIGFMLKYYKRLCPFEYFCHIY